MLALGLDVGPLFFHLVIGLLLLGSQGDQGHNAPFAVLVSLHDEEDVFHHHHADEGPDDHRHRRDDDLIDGAAVIQAIAQAFPKSVEGAGSDITKDHPKCRDGRRHGQRLDGR